MLGRAFSFVVVCSLVLAACSEETTDNFDAASVPASCTPEANVDGCGTSGQMGYACTGGKPPVQA
jgi:hypothetical protein